MTKCKLRLVCAFSAGLISTAALAGQTTPQVVEVDLVGGTAIGDMVTARTDKDKDVFIGCGTRNIDDGIGGLFNYAFCQAEDADGDTVICDTTDPALVQTVREINDYSFITFSWTDTGAGNLTCTSMGFSTQSFYLGKETKGN